MDKNNSALVSNIRVTEGNSKVKPIPGKTVTEAPVCDTCVDVDAVTLDNCQIPQLHLLVYLVG